MEWIVWSIVGAAVCGVIASAKKRNVFVWLVLGALFCVVSIIILLFLPKLENGSSVPLMNNIPPSRLNIPDPHNYNSDYLLVPQVLYIGSQWTVTTSELINHTRDGQEVEKMDVASITKVVFNKYSKGPTTARAIFSAIFLILAIVGVFASINQGSTVGLWVNFFLWGGISLLIWNGGGRWKKLIVTSKGENITIMDYPVGLVSFEEEANRIYQELLLLIRRL